MSKGKKGFVPNQHGAWAMLVIPFLFGMFASGSVWIHALLFCCWLLAYLFSYPFLQWVRTQKRIYVKPALVYAALLIPAATALILLNPGLARWGLLLLLPLIVNVYYARRNRERSLINDLAAVVLFSLMVFIAYDAGGGRDWTLAGELFAFSVLYFTGTVFYVKTIIRERNNIRFYRLSIAYHLALLVIAALMFPPALLLPLAVLLVRAIWSPKLKLNVKKTGVLEIAYSVMIAVTALAAYAA
jgi:hypothetical protein